MHYLTNNNLKTNQHIRFISEHLHKVNSGKINRLIVTMPPQHGKSSLISEFFTYWYLGINPDKRILLVTYASEFASYWTRRIKNHIADTGKMLFGIELDKNTESWFTLKNRNGSVTGLGIGGQVTGRSADLLIIDDPIKNIGDVNTTKQRDKLYNYYATSLLTRVQPTGSIIIIMTRWHKDDLVGRLLKDEPNVWTVLNLPAFAKENDMLGREIGEPLWKERYNTEILNQRKASLGSYYFSAMYQQNPISEEFQIFNVNWWQFYTELPTNFDYKLQVWDTAFKNKEENDYSVCITFGINNTGIYLIDLFRGKPLFPELKRTVKNYYIQHKPNLVCIEDAGSGQSIIQEIKDTEREVPIKALAPKNKVVRAHAITPLIEAGDVYLPKNAEWLTTFMNELADFPKGSHDDQVDCLTMGIEFLVDIFHSLKFPIKINEMKSKFSKSKNNLRGY